MSSMQPHPFIGIDMNDLARGQGEWQNMQDVIRRSFRSVFDHMSQQQDQIRQLNEVRGSTADVCVLGCHVMHLCMSVMFRP